MFLRKSRIERDPLAVTMTGVRLGEKALQIGEGDTRVVALIAARTGLTGTAAIVVLDDQAAARVRRAVTDIGALAEVGVVDREDPPADAAYDVIVVHDVEHTIAAPNDAGGTAIIVQQGQILIIPDAAETYQVREGVCKFAFSNSGEM